MGRNRHGVALDRLPKLDYLAAYAQEALRDKLIEHEAYIRERGEDMPEVRDWRWARADAGSASRGAED